MDTPEDKNAQHSESSKVGRPIHVADYQEGEEAKKAFEDAMKIILSVSKKEILEAEQADKPRKATS